MQRPERNDEMRRRCARLLLPEFARARVAPLIDDTGGDGCSARIVRLHGTRATLCYRFASGAAVYAKAHRGGVGRARFTILRALWEAGFNGADRLRIPEPLGFLESENLVFTREAQGTPLSRGLWECPLETAITRVRAAARWLAALHSTRLSCLDAEAPCARWRILEESDILVEAASARPEHASMLLEFLGYVEQLARASSGQPPLTPVHGQFIPSAVFVDSERVTAIDLDTLAVSDPAIDVASFISRVRYRKLFNARVEAIRAARLASEFRREYARWADRNLINLPYYLALYCLKEFAKYISSPDADCVARNRAERLCRAELERCLKQTTPLPDAAPGRRSAHIAALLAAAGLAAHAENAVPLATLLGTGTRSEAVEGCRAAARWLARLHQSHIRVGKAEPAWTSMGIFSVPGRLIEVGSIGTNGTAALLEILRQFRRQLEFLPGATRLAQTHGSYHPGHVLIADGAIAAIGLDHSLPADPAKDVARFIVGLEAGALDGRYDSSTASIAAGAFLEEYLSIAPGLETAISVDPYVECHRLLERLERLDTRRQPRSCAAER
jgi:aminoglycoside phosphotransferase (APT) family kinase protein